MQLQQIIPEQMNEETHRNLKLTTAEFKKKVSRQNSDIVDESKSIKFGGTRHLANKESHLSDNNLSHLL